MLEALLFALAFSGAIYLAFRNGPSDYDHGLKAFKAQDYNKAFALLEPYAIKRDTEAVLRLAYMYHFGLGTEKDEKKAFEHYLEAADDGVEGLEMILADFWLNGRGGKSDTAQALSWWRKAALKGNTEAMALLGKAHAEALGTVQDYVEAHRWYNLAASKGDKAARARLKLLSDKLTAEQLKTAQALAKRPLDADGQEALTLEPEAAAPDETDPPTPPAKKRRSRKPDAQTDEAQNE